MTATTRLRHWPFYTALPCALASLPVMWFAAPRYSFEVSAVTFFCVYLIMSARRLRMMTGKHLKTHARNTDEPEAVIFLVTFAAAATALVSLFFALNGESKGPTLELALAFASVVLGWATIHVMAAMHYAHVYWVPDDGAQTPAPQRGLDFPETPEPGGYDFLYFSFVIGMTAQTSDVAITTTAMRRINLMHAIVSFFFNTVLVAAAVNAAVQLAG
ncbi:MULTISPECIES: DUF1345 domain-containing protein [Ensifer]|jgi:uncharacterized membrane protein|uniref:DUF1345 domain-containing protein n=1 Tax=Ensifer canadensis TaxID=555315 RepID=A0AAW4FF46_9HYPH|nr:MULTISPECIES: DUF1345 domain-containing protein [Ensifer]MDP9629823.1 putative membrane protein [Ensifer adhaerens]KQU77145.1 hypothetical protein ASD00_37185 [Ensifer sp. Root31]KQW52703.1 hypothetical protein ASD02_31920 [Ensifer sp. Root1252]KQW63792.1 hypothetical protein ASD03_36355 [Ensifer sp. Root127]KQY65110.1 hypothetical protein ASD52_36010 [Ensifer sp. Root142]